VGHTKLGLLDPAKEHLSIELIGPSPRVERALGQALVTGNTFIGSSPTRLVKIWREGADRRFGKVTFSNNVCRHFDAKTTPTDATVMLSGDQIIALGNHIDAEKAKAVSMNLDNRPQVSLMGNITTGDLVNVTPAVRPSPIASFNVKF